jgi:hypothetical protein
MSPQKTALGRYVLQYYFLYILITHYFYLLSHKEFCILQLTFTTH